METLYDKYKSKLNNWTFLVRNPALPTEILEEIMKDYDGKVILADDLIEIN